MPATALALAILAVASSLVLVLRQQRHMRRHLQQAQQHQHSLQQALKHLEARAFAQAATVAQSLPGTLGSALAEMARSQAQVEQAAEMRNWHAEGMARFSDVLRQHSQLKDLSNALISEVCKYLKAQQGVLFLLKDIQGNELQVAGTFVSGQVAALLHDLNQGGLVEQVRRDSQPVHLKEVPPGYVAVKSGLGEAHPAELLLVPVLFEHKLLGVLELATFQPLRAEDLALAQELADKSAATFFNLMNAEQTTIMLEESQQLAFQLGEQTTAIRQASEEMRIKDRAITSSSSSIIIVDAQAPNMPIQYVNPAFEQTTGWKLEEVIGKNCRFLQGHDTEQEGLKQLRVAMKAREPCTVVLRNFRKDGTMFWNELSISPVQDEYGDVTHYVGVQNDIGDRVLLEEAQEQMRALNENLEEMVQDRTAELEHTLAELQSTQHRMVQSEKLASLGQLIAGVAHEINTPLAAVKASVENMSDFLPQTLNALPPLMAEMDETTRGCFQQVVETAMKNSGELSTRDERKLRKELETTLQEMNIPQPKDKARALLGAGVRQAEGLEALLPILSHTKAEEILRTAYHIAQLRNNMNIIGHAAEKTRKTVYALKSYSHFQQEDRMELMDLNESLDVVLTLYHNQLKHGIAVETNFQSGIPRMLGYSDELGQVWTNIIHNAAQAMQYDGKLTLHTRMDGEIAIVSIADNGPGIPQDVLPRIFEPFFTTKPQGEGTGLGLDICKKIIEKHSGEVEVETGPSGTTFTVRLPIRTSHDQLDIPEEVEMVDAIIAQAGIPAAAESVHNEVPPQTEPEN